MANIIRTTKKVIVNGVVTLVTVEVDKRIDEKIRTFEVAGKIQASLGFSIDNSANSTIGKGKHTGNMAKAGMARNYKGTCSRKAWRKMEAIKAQKELSNA